MSDHRSPVAQVSKLLYVAMVISAMVSIAIYVVLGRILFDLIRSSDTDSVADLLWLIVTVISVPLTLGAILYTAFQTRMTAALGGLITMLAGVAWNLVVGEQEIALLLLAPTAMIVLIAIGLVVRRPANHGLPILSQPD